eukprot:1624886-Karenia_brevis.AAC.1
MMMMMVMVMMWALANIFILPLLVHRGTLGRKLCLLVHFWGPGPDSVSGLRKAGKRRWPR